MAYTPPVYNQVSVDLYESGGVSVPTYNQVSVDLYYGNGSAPPVSVILTFLSDGAVFPLEVTNYTQEVVAPLISSAEDVYPFSIETVGIIELGLIDAGSIFSFTIQNQQTEIVVPLIYGSEIYSIILGDSFIAQNDTGFFMLL